MQRTKLGLLTLYLDLYNKKLPEYRKEHEEFKKIISNEFLDRNIDVVDVPICSLESDFRSAVEYFEREKVDCIVTLHLAYSPSLESVNILANTKLPIIILDTTFDYSFSSEVDAKRIFYNHGIHGVQDMCNLLLRNNKKFQIEAGHWKESDVIDRVVEDIKSAKLASFIGNSRIGIIGSPFSGMGDFRVPFDKLKEKIGIEVIQSSPKEISKYVAEISDDELSNEIVEDKKLYICDEVEEDILRETNSVGLGVRKWVQKENLSGFSMNFNEIDMDFNLKTIPFLEASKSMVRGLGYAGEGDVLTSALVASLLSEYFETSFVEIFCPSWEKNSLMLSHMGEMNLSLSSTKSYIIKSESPCIDSHPAIAVGCFKAGDALLINLAPVSDEVFRLIIVPVEVQEVKAKIKNTIQGWIKPKVSISTFLEDYSKLGGTHHQAMVYNADINVIKKFALIMNWDVFIIS